MPDVGEDVERIPFGDRAQHELTIFHRIDSFRRTLTSGLHPCSALRAFLEACADQAYQICVFRFDSILFGYPGTHLALDSVQC